MKTLAKIILGVSVLAGLSQFAEAGEKKLSVTGEAGFVGGATTIGVGVKRGKYTMDVHSSVGSPKKVTSIGVARDLLKLEDISLGLGLSAIKVESKSKWNIKKTSTSQALDLNIDYNLGKYKFRGSINTNGDVKAGFGINF